MELVCDTRFLLQKLLFPHWSPCQRVVLTAWLNISRVRGSSLLVGMSSVACGLDHWIPGHIHVLVGGALAHPAWKVCKMA